MNVLNRLHELQNERGWTDYETAKRAGLSHSTISNIYKRNTIPNIFTLEAICKGFGITLSQFFWESDNDTIELTVEDRELFYNWIKLSDENKSLILQLIKKIV